MPSVLLPERFRHGCCVLLVSGQRDVLHRFAFVVSRIPDVKTHGHLYGLTLFISSRNSRVASTSISKPSGSWIGSPLMTTPYCVLAPSILTYSSRTSRFTRSGSRLSGSPQPPPPLVM